jgi:hypothetical protein
LPAEARAFCKIDVHGAYRRDTQLLPLRIGQSHLFSQRVGLELIGMSNDMGREPGGFLRRTPWRPDAGPCDELFRNLTAATADQLSGDPEIVCASIVIGQHAAVADAPQAFELA